MKILWLGYEKYLGIEFMHSCFKMSIDNYNEQYALNFKPDIIIEREYNDGKSDFTDKVLFLKEKFPKTKTAVWLIDTHVRHDYHLEKAKNYDYVFLAISRYINEFKKINKNTFYLPLCFPKAKKPLLSKKINKTIGFVGRWNLEGFEKRTELLNTVYKIYPDLCHFIVDYETPYQSMSSCYIMLNYSIGEELNFRVFEALACGNILITNDVEDIYKIKDLKNYIYTFKDIDEALNIIRDVLEKRPDNSKAKEFVYKNHMLYHRVLAILKMIDEKKQILF